MSGLAVRRRLKAGAAKAPQGRRGQELLAYFPASTSFCYRSWEPDPFVSQDTARHTTRPRARAESNAPSRGGTPLHLAYAVGRRRRRVAHGRVRRRAARRVGPSHGDPSRGRGDRRAAGLGREPRAGHLTSSCTMKFTKQRINDRTRWRVQIIKRNLM